MIFIKSKITWIEHYVPNNRVTNDDMTKFVETSDEWIYKRTGISARYITTGENTSDLSYEAVKKAIDKGLVIDDIDMIIVATLTPDFKTPSTACILQHKLGIKKGFAFDLNAACTGFVYALSVADMFIKGGKAKKVLLVGSEVLSKIMDFTDRGTCVLFADGAAMCVLEASDDSSGIDDFQLYSDGEKGEKLTAGEDKANNPFTKTVENREFIHMDGREIFEFAVYKVPESLKNMIETNNFTYDDFKYIVPHQANSRIIETVSKKLKVPMDKFYMNMHEYGNTSSASIGIALSEIYNKGLVNKGDKLLLAGFGAGLTWGSMIITV